MTPLSTSRQVAEPVNVQFTHNFRARPVLEHSGVRITILDATSSELTYSLELGR